MTLLVAGCSSAPAPTGVGSAPAGPARTIRVALADLRWPLDPALAAGRDQTTLARAVYATPLRVAADGSLQAGLCSSWRPRRSFRSWRLRCRSAPTIAAELRRVARLERSPARWIFAAAKRIDAPTRSTLVIEFPFPWRRFPYALSSVAAAPRGVPGRFRVVHASSDRVVARRGQTTLEFRRLKGLAAVRAFRRGEVDEGPVSEGDIRSSPAASVRVRQLKGLDLIVVETDGRLADSPGLREAYWQTANRGDYEALVTEGQAPAAFTVLGGGRQDPAEFRRALRSIPALPRLRVRFAVPPSLAYGAGLLYGQWREAGLGPAIVPVSGARSDARLLRLIPAYLQPEALSGALVFGNRLPGGAAVRQALGRVNPSPQLAQVAELLRQRAFVIPIAGLVDARLVSARLRGWRETALGDVDYTRVIVRNGL